LEGAPSRPSAVGEARRTHGGPLKRNRLLQLLVATLAALALTAPAFARIELEATAFSVSSFGGGDKIDATCGTASPSFFCNTGETELTRITSKGVDYFFDEAGQLVAAYGKQQRGQKLKD